jgi:hypothetical protein
MTYKTSSMMMAGIIAGALFFVPESFAQNTQVRPGMVGGATPPNATNPPSNPSQAPTPSAPGVVLTYPNNPPTKVKCTHNGKEVPC